MQQHIFYDILATRPERKGRYAGIVDLNGPSGDTLLPDADYYICGPAQCIHKQVRGVAALDVPRKSIRFEEFGPATLSV